MSEHRQDDAVSLRGNETWSLDDPRRAWRIEQGTLAIFAVERIDGEPAGSRRFLFESGPGEAVFGTGSSGLDAPAVVAVAIDAVRLTDLGPFAAGPESHELFSVWRDRWEVALGTGGSEEKTPEPEAFHARLPERLSGFSREHSRRESDGYERSRAQSRERAHEAVTELTAVLSPEVTALPQGSDLFVAACVVAQSSGISLCRPAAWRDDTERTDPIETIAAASHVRTRKVLLHDEWWRADCGALLAFTAEEGRPLALLPRGPGKYDVFDPRSRAKGPVTADIISGLGPEAHQFYRPLPEEAASGPELVRFALRGRGRDVLVLLAAAGVATVLGMFAPQATALLVDQAIPDADRALLWQLGLGLLAAAFGAAAFRFTQGIAMMRVETGADVATQSAVWDRLLHLQLAFFRRFTTGDLLSRVTAISQIRAYLSGTTLRTLFSSVVALLNLGLLVYYSPGLTLVALGAAAVSCVLTVGSGVAILRYYRRILEIKGQFFGLLVQLINGVPKLRVAAAEQRAFGQWARTYSRLARLELKQRWVQDNVQVANLGLSTLSTVVLFAAAARLVGHGGSGPALTTGVFLAFNVAYGTFVGAVVGLSNTITDVMAIAILRERARPILDNLPEVNRRKTDPGRIEGRLSVDHVRFQYRDDGPVILDDVSIAAEPGEFIAVVGPSGSGKSTLFRLILGFESPQSGTIHYDGQDLTGLDVQAVRRQLGVVLQGGRINAGSLFENIVCGTRVTLNDAWEAAGATGFADDISAMPMGMHTMISEGGTNLSGGQRQRLLLTRALVHRPRLLLLDEATSALDNQTQAIVSESLDGLDVTRVVIAHRLSTIRHADRIFVIDSGRVVQAGSFDELAAQEGIFARLMARQLA